MRIIMLMEITMTKHDTGGHYKINDHSLMIIIMLIMIMVMTVTKQQDMTK